MWSTSQVSTLKPFSNDTRKAFLDLDSALEVRWMANLCSCMYRTYICKALLHGDDYLDLATSPSKASKTEFWEKAFLKFSSDCRSMHMLSACRWSLLQAPNCCRGHNARPGSWHWPCECRPFPQHLWHWRFPSIHSPSVKKAWDQRPHWPASWKYLLW